MNIVLVFTYSQFRTAINLFDNLNSTAAVSEYTMSVVVPKDSDINSINDLSGADVAAPVSSDGDNINKLMKDIRAKNNNKSLDQWKKKVILALMMIVLPALVGMYILADPLYSAFYSRSLINADLLRFYLPLANFIFSLQLNEYNYASNKIDN